MLGLFCSNTNNVIDASTATSKRVLIEGPVANISFIAVPRSSAVTLFFRVECRFKRLSKVLILTHYYSLQRAQALCKELI